MAEAETAPVEEVHGRGWALLATSLGFAVVQLDVSVVDVAIQPIGADLGVSVAGLQGVVLVGPLVAAGFALGVLVPVITAALLGSVEPSRSGVASGTLNTARQTGSVLGVSVFGALAAGCAVLALGVRAQPG